MVYEQIVNYYFKKILEKEILPGDQLDSEITAAKKFEVSRGTVTKAFNYLKKIGVCHSGRGKKTVVSAEAVDIIRCLNPMIADSHKKICVLVVNDGKYLGYIVHCIKERAELMGWACDVMYNCDQVQEKRCIDEIIERKYDGLIVTPYRSNGYFCKENYIKLQRENIPFVMIGKPDKSFACNAVYTDDFIGSHDITHKLIVDKCSQIIHVTDRREDKITYDDRKMGYLEAMNSYRKGQTFVFDSSDPRFKRAICDYLNTHAKGKIGVNLYSDRLEPIIRPIFNEYNIASEIIGFREQYNDEESCILTLGIHRKEIAIRSLNVLKNCIESLSIGAGVCVTHTIFNSDYNIIN